MREGALPGGTNFGTADPHWIPFSAAAGHVTEDVQTLWYDPRTYDIALTPPQGGGFQGRGGILAEEMGLGKTVRWRGNARRGGSGGREGVRAWGRGWGSERTLTWKRNDLGKQVELLGLILANPRPPIVPGTDGLDEDGYYMPPEDGGFHGDGTLMLGSSGRPHGGSDPAIWPNQRPLPSPTDTTRKLAIKTTLIVAPSTILYQWHDEIRLHTPQLTVFVYSDPKMRESITPEKVCLQGARAGSACRERVP